MRKKIILLIILLCVAVIIFAGCSPQIVDNGTAREIKYDCFALIEPTKTGFHSTYLCYDINTGVMYYIIDGVYRAGITPYYVFDGESMEIRVGHYPEDYNK